MRALVWYWRQLPAWLVQLCLNDQNSNYSGVLWRHWHRFMGSHKSRKRDQGLTIKFIFLSRWWVGRNTLREKSVLQILGFLSSFPTLRALRSVFPSPTSKSLLILIPLIFMDIYAQGFYILSCMERGKTGARTNTVQCHFLGAPKMQVPGWEMRCEAVDGTRAWEIGIFTSPLTGSHAGLVVSPPRSGIPLDLTEDPDIFSHPGKEFYPLGWSKWLWIRNQGFGFLFSCCFYGLGQSLARYKMGL